MITSSGFATTSFATDLVFQGSLRLVVAVVLAISVLWLVRVRLPRLHRWMWAAVLIQSLLLGPLAITLPVLSPIEPMETIGSVAFVDNVANPPSNNLAVADGSGGTRVVDAQATSAPWLSLRFIGMVWCVGFVGVMLVFVFCHLIVQQSLRRAVPARESWQHQLDRVKTRLGIASQVEMRTTSSWGPLLTRSWNGHCIVVPRSTWESLCDEQRDAVLIHELAHMQRGDLKWSLLMRLAASFHWFNPLAWWVVAKFDEAAEWACDGVVARQSDRHAAALAGALIQFSGPKPLIRLGVSMARGSKVSVRVRRLVDPSPIEESKMKKCLLGGLAALILVTGLLRLELVAKDLDNTKMKSGSGSGSGVNIEFTELLSELADSSDELQQRLVASLQTESGQLVLRDHLQKQSGGDGSVGPAELVDVVLEKHFVDEGALLG